MPSLEVVLRALCVSAVNTGVKLGGFLSVRITLGQTGLQVSPLCYGTFQLTPQLWGPQPEDVMLAAMRKAFDLGINFFDTAPSYGLGYGEELLGHGLKDLPRQELVVTTKVFNHYPPDGSRYGDLSAEHIQRECEASLRRLGLEYLDLYQCHAWDPLADPAATAEALKSLQRQGKIRHYGVSNWSVEQVRLGLRYGAYATHQPKYSLFDREIEQELLPFCQQQNLGVLVYSPLGKGLLTGKYKGTEALADYRKDRADFQGARFQELCGRVARLEPIASGYGLSITQLTLAVTLLHPGIHCAIVGIKTPEQIAEAAGMLGKTISKADGFRVREILAG